MEQTTDRIAACAAALRRHRFEVETVATPEEAFEIMKRTMARRSRSSCRSATR